MSREPRQGNSCGPNRIRINLLLGSQRLHGFDGSGAAGGKNGSRKGDQEDRNRGQHENHRIERIDLEQHAAQRARGKHRSQDTDSATRQPMFRARSQNQPHHACCAANRARDGRQLMRAQGGRKGNDAVDAEQSQQHGGSGKAGDDYSIETARSLPFGKRSAPSTQPV
jgi:hypothetical protein